MPLASGMLGEQRGGGMKALQLGLMVVLTCGASLGIVALSWHKSANASPLGLGLGVHTEPSPLLRARGTLETIDPAANTVTLAMEDESVRLKVDANTTVFVEGRWATVEELAPGEAVCAAWEKGPSPIAEWLEPCAR